MRSIKRKSAPGVKAGRVQKKNNWEPSSDLYDAEVEASEPGMLPILRKRPGEGFRHVLRQKDVLDFIGILPQWDELSRGLNAVVLAPGRPDSFGYHLPGVVHLCAWERQMWTTVDLWYHESRRDTFERLGVACEPDPDEEGRVRCLFTEETARAYLLLSTFLHELGHHHDRMTTRSRLDSCRGEPFAVAYAAEHGEKIWTRYCSLFDL